jgi:hypothetical protein
MYSTKKQRELMAEEVAKLKDLATIINNLEAVIEKEEINNPAIVSRIATIKEKIKEVIKNLETIT